MKNKLSHALRKQSDFFMMIPAVIWQVLFFSIPMLCILGLSFVRIEDGNLFFTFAHYVNFFEVKYFTILLRSVFLACFTTFMCLLIGYPLAFFLAFRAKKWKNILLILLVLPFLTSLLVLSYAWFFVLDKHGLLNNLLLALDIISEPLIMLNTQFAVYLVMVYCYIPFMVLPIYSVLEKLNKRLLEASYDLGASRYDTFIRIVFPLSKSGVQTGALLVFIQSFGEFVIPELLGGGKRFYIGSLISHYFLVSRNPFLGSAFACLSSLLLVVIVTVLYRLVKKIIPHYK